MQNSSPNNAKLKRASSKVLRKVPLKQSNRKTMISVVEACQTARLASHITMHVMRTEIVCMVLHWSIEVNVDEVEYAPCIAPRAIEQ